VVFAVVGVTKVLWGLTRSPAVTAGRGFVRNGELNLIFGEVLRPVDRYSGRQVEPFVPGLRASPRRLSASIVAGPGVGFHEDAAGVRPDWVVVKLGDGGRKPVPPPDSESTERPAAPAPAIAAPTAPAEGPGDSVSAGGGEIRGERVGEESPEAEAIGRRLGVVEELRRRGLISEEEYRAKRKEILDDI